MKKKGEKPIKKLKPLRRGSLKKHPTVVAVLHFSMGAIDSLGTYGGDDEARTRDLRRDRAAL